MNQNNNTKEILNFLKSKVNIDNIYDSWKAPISTLLEYNFSEDRVKNPAGEFMNEIPDWLNFELPLQVKSEYDFILKEKYALFDLTSEISAEYEKLQENYGVDSDNKALGEFIDYLRRQSLHYAGIYNNSSVSQELKDQFEAAKRITLREQFMQDNNKDIRDFLKALKTYTRDILEVQLVYQISRLYKDLADSLTQKIKH
ncbi:MAG: hypothetical protein J1F12_00415 [Muribaculaceae bacterium]|nr:hypothetical protein [Muribaculaceae bacterium]